MAGKRKRTNPRSVEAALPQAGVGGYVLEDAPVVFNAGKTATTLKVRNTGDRPIQVGSHFHFFDIPSSTAIRFEPGDERTVRLVPFGGLRRVYGFNNLVDGDTDGKAEKAAAVARMRARKYKSS